MIGVEDRSRLWLERMTEVCFKEMIIKPTVKGQEETRYKVWGKKNFHLQFTSDCQIPEAGKSLEY